MCPYWAGTFGNSEHSIAVYVIAPSPDPACLCLPNKAPKSYSWWDTVTRHARNSPFSVLLGEVTVNGSHTPLLYT